MCIRDSGSDASFLDGGSWGMYVAADGDARIFLDASNGRIYINDGNTYITEGSSNSFRVQTNSGYLDIGPKNSSWCHFDTDRASFYFANQTSFNGTVWPYTHNSKDLGTYDKRWRTVYTNGVCIGIEDSQTIDDYEEGYHDTTITVGSGSINSYTSRRLRYVKIGSQVTVWGRMHWSASSSGNMSSFKFSLPYTMDNSVEYETSNNFQAIRATSYNQQEGFRTFRVKPNTSLCTMQDNNGSDHGHFGTSNPHLNVFLCYSSGA